jgi:hypothetical protein
MGKMATDGIASTGARLLAASVLLGEVACSGGSFNSADASTGSAGDDDASGRTVVVVPSDVDAGADAAGPSDDGGLDAPGASGADATSGDAAPDAQAVCSPGASCATPHGATSTCDDGGACVVTRCEDGYLDCDGNRTNGCETEFNTLDCGGCGVFCNPSHVLRAICTMGTIGCVYNACEPGYRDCDGDKSNGCETPSDGGDCP